tara:strand:- start:43 stop:666 length:624 start_codon:yes stop_codon:yes gene_type:complete
VDKFKLRSGNKTSFKEMGSSPLKQHYPSSAQKGPHGPKGTLDEVKRIAGEKATKATKAANAKKYGMESLNKEINRIAKGGKPKAELLKKTKNVVSKKSTSFIKKLYRGLGGKLFGVAGTVLGATKTASADQPGTGTHGGEKVGSIRNMMKSSPAKEKGKKESDEVFIARAKRQKKQVINKLTNKAKSEGLSGQEAIDAAKKQYKKNI